MYMYSVRRKRAPADKGSLQSVFAARQRKMEALK